MSISFTRNIGLTLFAVLLGISAFFFFASLQEAHAALSSQWVFGSCPAGWSSLRVTDCDGSGDPSHSVGEGTNCAGAGTKWNLCIDDSATGAFSVTWGFNSCSAGYVNTGLIDCDSPPNGHDVNANSCTGSAGEDYLLCIDPPSDSTLSTTWASSCPAGYVNTNLLDDNGGSHRLEENSGGTAGQRLCLRNVISSPAPVCSPASQSVSTGQSASMSASSGNGTFSWSAPGGSPTSGSGSSFSTSYSTTGTKTVTLTSGGQTDTCSISVSAGASPPSCSPSSQSATVGQSRTVTASGGNGSYSWSAPGGTPSVGSGSSLSVSYSTTGTKTITLTSNGQTDTCTISVSTAGTPPVCSPASQSATVGQSRTMTASGGNGTFSWSAPGGSPTSGSGSSFSTSYSTTGTKTVTLTSAGLTDTCSISVSSSAPTADLDMASFGWIGSPANGAPGTVATVSYQFYLFNGPVGAFTVAAGANSSIGCNTGGGPTTSHSSASTGYSSPGTVTFTRPSTPGPYTGVVMVDYGCVIPESNDGNNTRTFTYTVTNPFDYILTNGGNRSVVQGQQVTNTITATLLSGTTQPISFSSSGLPAGASASFTPCSPSSGPTCSSTMTITAGASTPAGNSTITVTGTAGTVVHTTPFTLTVSVAQCNDGTDNDGDGLNNFGSGPLNDPGCSSATDNDESDGTSQCQDGADNDLDGRTDYGGANPDAGCSSPQDNNESDDPIITGTLTASPTTGPSSLQVMLLAEIFGAWAPTTNYSFWWNCSYADPTPTYAEAENACGILPSTCNPTSIGIKCDGESSTSFSKFHTYTNTGQTPMSVRPIVIIEHGNQALLANDSVTVNPVLSAVSCSPPSINATRGASRTFTASGGSGNYTWSTFPSADCAETNGNTNPTYTVYCTSNGNREIKADDDDPNTPGDTCILKVGAPGFGEF